MKEKPKQVAFNNLAATFRDMDHADFLAGVQASLGYVCDYVAWQNEAEDAIEPLEQMAWHGDERAFRSLLYLGTKIATILERHAALASGSSEYDGDPFLQIIPNRQEDASLGSSLTREDLEILASLPDEKRRGIGEQLEKFFPEVQTTFFPKCLLKISLNASTGLPATFDNPENLTAPEFEKLESLTGKLAAVRASLDCTRMVLEEMARADVWPVALSPIKELRNGQLKRFESLHIGSKLPFHPNPPTGSGNTTTLGKGGATDFYLSLFWELESERTYPRSGGHLDAIRISYAEYLDRIEEGGFGGPFLGEIEQASKVQQWNKLNEWRAVAAMLEPLTSDTVVIASWIEAGVKLVRSKSNDLTDLGMLPDSLWKEMTESTAAPSPKRILTDLKNALKKAFDGIAARSEKARQKVD